MPDSELFKPALNKAMALCARREYSAGDISSKLQSWGINDYESARIIELLKKNNFLNEERYSIAFVRDKFKYNKWGKVKIAAHLRAKKLPPDVIKSALDSIEDEQYKKSLCELIESHRRSVKAKNQYDLKAKLLRYGLSKGFESNLLYDILNEIEE